MLHINEACSNMVANILGTDTPSTWGGGGVGGGGGGQTVKPYLKVVMLHIKLKGIEHRAP